MTIDELIANVKKIDIKGEVILVPAHTRPSGGLRL